MKPLTLLGLAALGVGGILTGFTQVKRVKRPGHAKQVETPSGNLRYPAESIKRGNPGARPTTGKTAMPAVRYDSTIMENRQPLTGERPTFYIPSHAAILILE